MSDLILKCGVCEASLPEGRRKYCSTACSNRGKRKRSTRPGSKECVRCKCTFKVPRRGPVGDYCSQVCRSASYNAREEVKERSRERHLRSREAKTAEIVEANLSIPDASCAQCGAPTPVALMVGLKSTAPALAFPGLSIIEIKTTGVRVRKWIVVARSRQRVFAVLTIRLSGGGRIGISRAR